MSAWKQYSFEVKVNVSLQIETSNSFSLSLCAPSFHRLMLSSFYDPFSPYLNGHKLIRNQTKGSDGCHPTDHSLFVSGQAPGTFPSAPGTQCLSSPHTDRWTKEPTVFMLICQVYSQIDHICTRTPQGSRGPFRESMPRTSFLFIMRA